MKKIKWTQTKVNKLTRDELITFIEQATNTTIVFTRASNMELRQELIGYINKGLV